MAYVVRRGVSFGILSPTRSCPPVSSCTSPRTRTWMMIHPHPSQIISRWLCNVPNGLSFVRWRILARIRPYTEYDYMATITSPHHRSKDRVLCTMFLNFYRDGKTITARCNLAVFVNFDPIDPLSPSGRTSLISQYIHIQKYVRISNFKNCTLTLYMYACWTNMSDFLIYYNHMCTI